MPNFATGFRGTAHGAVQTAYTDQPGVGYPGMQAYASDNILHDAMFISEADGIAAGKGVVFAHLTEAAHNLQRPNKSADLPTVASTAEDFAGILMFDEAMQSDENGIPGWAKGRVGRIARPHRSGSRLYVKARENIELTDTVNWVIVAPADGSYEVGEFAPAALGGGDAGTSVVLNGCRWETEADAGGIAVIEMLEGSTT